MQIIETKFEARAPGECSVTDDRLEDLIAATDTWVGREIFIVHKLRGLNKLTHTNCFDGWTRMMDVHANGKSLTLQGIGERWEVAGVPCKDIGDEIAFIEANPQVAIEEIRSYKPAGSKPVDSAAWTGRGSVRETEQEKPAKTSSEAVQREISALDLTVDLIRRLTDCARDLDTVRRRALAEAVRNVRNQLKRGEDLPETKHDFGDPHESGRQEGLRQALADIENYPTAFAMAMKRNLVDLIQERIRGER